VTPIEKGLGDEEFDHFVGTDGFGSAAEMDDRGIRRDHAALALCRGTHAKIGLFAIHEEERIEAAEFFPQ